MKTAKDFAVEFRQKLILRESLIGLIRAVQADAIEACAQVVSESVEYFPDSNAMLADAIRKLKPGAVR